MEPCNILTLEGLVVPSKWDQEGKILGITVACFDEKEYPVLMDSIGNSMKELLHEKVTVNGRKVTVDNTDLLKIITYNRNW